MAYFRNVADILYQSQSTDVKGSADFVRAKNLFKRAKIRDDLFQSAVAFEKYKIIGEERPDQVAERIYGTSQYDWVVLLANNIINIRTEWPLSDFEIDDYISRKYTQEERTQPHHFETVSKFDSRGKLIVPSGKIVDSNFSVSYYDEQLSQSVTVFPVKSVSNFEYEIKINDDKRNIFILRSRFLQTVISDMEEIMSYGFSSQYVDPNTKKGENFRILSPR
jgi:hypothetical protein